MFMGFREYARHRDVSLRAVQKAIEANRITIVEIDGRKKIDRDQADRDWLRLTDPAKQSLLHSAGPRPGNKEPPAGSATRRRPVANDGLDEDDQRSVAYRQAPAARLRGEEDGSDEPDGPVDGEDGSDEPRDPVDGEDGSDEPEGPVDGEDGSDERRDPADDGDGADEEDREDDDPHTEAYRQARAERERIRVDREQIELDQLRGKYIDIADANRMVFTAFRALRDAVFNMPARIKDQVAAETDAFACEQMMEAELSAALDSFNPAKALRDTDNDDAG
jgi:hypothetical protein